MNSDEYTYELIDNEDDARTCAQLVADEFVAVNSMVILDRLNPQSMFDEDTWPTMLEMFHERLSFLARHRQSGEIVAAISACDLYLAQKRHPYDPSSAPSAIPYFDLLEDLDNIFIHHDFQQELKPNMVLQIVIGATRVEHSGKGIATRLRTVLCEYARDKRGFQYALAQTTNEATRHIYVDKMGGIPLTTIDPKTWIWKKKGDQVRPYKDHTGIPIPNILIKL
ncbi:unnamed protein product [Adineta ricciae]|uniref:N-acetyltransferase domain-containing protein n=1 Tax=Adineta ricciae TaxID=249248 RepID=A0A815NFW8_ADIRI|nr:unnamed protein product [Adineta ricciae]CAF1628616.1 unnamed protein product [Adineta ricciae]